MQVDGFARLLSRLTILLLVTCPTDASPAPRLRQIPIAATPQTLASRTLSPPIHNAAASKSLLSSRSLSENYLWAHGWTMFIQQGPIVLPTLSGAEMLSDVYSSIMAIAAAKMLDNAATVAGGALFTYQKVVVDFMVVDQAMGGLKWDVVYWFAAHMQMMARRGFTGLGVVRWNHESGLTFNMAVSVAGVPLSLPLAWGLATEP